MLREPCFWGTISTQFLHLELQNEAPLPKSKIPKPKLEPPILVPQPSVGKVFSLPLTQKETEGEMLLPATDQGGFTPEPSTCPMAWPHWPPANRDLIATEVWECMTTLTEGPSAVQPNP